MKSIKLIVLFLALGVLAGSCKKDDDKNKVDNDVPVIDLIGNSFPIQCSTLKRGETFIFRVQLRDNMELGSYSLDIHHNFDHHSHSTEVQECVLAPKKTPVKPFLLIQSYEIPAGLREHEAVQQIRIPTDVDPGDYHFMISVTDKAGWNSIKGLSIKITE